jgi:hypothetical protein
MEKRTLGIILTLLGVAGLILAGVNFLTEKGTSYNIKQILTFGILEQFFSLQASG